MISHFVKTHLRFHVERLRAVMLTGVELLVPVTEELDQLVQLTDRIDCDDRCMVWPFNLVAYKVFLSLYGYIFGRSYISIGLYISRKLSLLGVQVSPERIEIDRPRQRPLVKLHTLRMLQHLIELHRPSLNVVDI